MFCFSGGYCGYFQQSLGHLFPDAISNHGSSGSTHHPTHLVRSADNNDPVAVVLSFSERLPVQSGDPSLFGGMAERERQGLVFHRRQCRLLLLAATFPHITLLRHDMDTRLESVYPHGEQRRPSRSNTTTFKGIFLNKFIFHCIPCRRRGPRRLVHVTIWKWACSSS